MAVPCRNQRLFRRVFWSHRCLWSAVSLNSHKGRGSFVLCSLMSYSYIHEVCMSPTLNRCPAIRHFKHSNVIKIRDGITFHFYTGLPHMNWRIFLRDKIILLFLQINLKLIVSPSKCLNLCESEEHLAKSKLLLGMATVPSCCLRSWLFSACSCKYAPHQS